MKTNYPALSGITRTGAIIATTLGLAVVSAFATPTVELKVGGKDKNGKDFEFGKGIELNATSGTWRLSASKAYTYKLVGTCTGTGALAGAFPKGTPITTFLNFLKPGDGSLVAGIYDNPKGRLGFKVIDKTFVGNKTLPNFGKVTLSAKVVAGTTSTGEVYLNVTEVKFTSTNPTPLGTIKFDKGAKFIINTAPQIQFNAKGQEPFLESVENVQILVTRFGNTKGRTTVNYTTVDDTAISIGDLDFKATAGTLVFEKNVTEAFITVPITDNLIDQPNRSFKIVLSTPQAGSVIGRNPENTVVINDND